MNTKKFFLGFLVLSSLFVISCTNENDDDNLGQMLRTSPMLSANGFKIEGDTIRISSIDDMPLVEKAMENAPCYIKIVTANSSGSLERQKSVLVSLEKMAPTEGGNTGTAIELYATLYVRPVYVFKGDPTVKMESHVSLDTPTVYRYLAWVVSKNIAEWRDNNSKIEYTIEGTLYAEYPVVVKNPTTQKDSVIYKPMSKTIYSHDFYHVN